MVPSGDARLQDPQALAEIELYGELVIAASASDQPLSSDEIDQILGLSGPPTARPAPPEAPSHRRPALPCRVPDAGPVLRRPSSVPLASLPGPFSARPPPTARPAAPDVPREMPCASPPQQRLLRHVRQPRGRTWSSVPACSRSSSAPSTSERKAIAEKMRAAEHAGDEATHAIMRQLNEHASSRRSTARTSTGSRRRSTTSWTSWRPPPT